MIVEYQKSTITNDKDGWEERYLNEYGNLNEFRLKLLIQDGSILKVLHKIYGIMLELRNKNKEIKILDVGCGTGHQLMQISHLCDVCVGFDISKEIINQNNSLQTSAKFIYGDVLEQPIFDNKFNIVLMAGVLYSISGEKEVHKKIFSEIYRQLDDDGYFIFYHRGYLNTITNFRLIMQNLIDKVKSRSRTQYYMCWFDDEYVSNLLINQGFKIEKIDKDDFAYPLIFGLPSKIFEKKDADGYISEKRLNFFGKIIYFFARNFFPKLSARTSIFIARK